MPAACDAIAGATFSEIDGGNTIVYTAPDAVADWILGLD